jgi:hypothetical protein
VAQKFGIARTAVRDRIKSGNMCKVVYAKTVTDCTGERTFCSCDDDDDDGDVDGVRLRP